VVSRGVNNFGGPYDANARDGTSSFAGLPWNMVPNTAVRAINHISATWYETNKQTRQT
jgi:hypothetical protein